MDQILEADQRYSLRPGVEIRRVSRREYVVQYGLVPRHSVLVKDDSRTVVSRVVIPYIVENRSFSLEEVVNLVTEEKEKAAELLETLVQHRLLVEESDIYFAAQGVFPDSGAKSFSVGLVGMGLEGYVALDVLGRYSVFLSSVHVRMEPSVIKSDVAYGLFPYLPESQPLSPVTMADSLKLADRVTVGSLERIFEQVDIVAVATSELDVTELLTIDELALKTGKPWIFMLALGEIGIAGPLVVPYETACFHEFLEYASISGLMRFIEGDRLTKEATLVNSLLLTPYHIALQVASIGIVEMLKHLTGNSCRLAGAIYVYDGERGLVTSGKVLRIPGSQALSTLNGYQDPPVNPPEMRRVLAQ